MAGISLREFARTIGVSAQAVSQALPTGRIPAEFIGRDPKRGWPTILDPEAAAAAWRRNTDTAKKRPKETYQDSAARGWAGRRGEDPPPTRYADPEPTGEAQRGRVPSINESKAITEAYKARMARLEYEEKAGKLVNAAEFKVAYTQQVVAARNSLRGVPSKAKTLIPHLTAADVATIARLIDEALSDVADGVA